MNNRFWSTEKDESGEILYHYLELATSETVQSIMIKAQANTTELGYWRDVATDLAALVDELVAERDALRASLRVLLDWCERMQIDGKHLIGSVCREADDAQFRHAIERAHEALG